MCFELPVKEAQECWKKSAMDNSSLKLEDQNANINAKSRSKAHKVLEKRKILLPVLKFLFY